MMISPTRVLLTWELGDNFGHLAVLVKLAEALHQQGADVYLALQNLASAAPFIKDIQAVLLQAPYARIKPPSDPKRPVLTYADDLRPCGYDNPRELATLLRAWRDLYELVSPDVLVVNSSPTALLAAKESCLLTVHIGTGYEVPKLSVPMPPLRYWEPTDQAIIAQHEAQVLSVINQARLDSGLTPIEAVQDFLRTDLTFISTFPELDPYGVRDDAQHIGPVFFTATGEVPVWPPAKEGVKRVFAYLSHGADIGAVITALYKSPHDVILVAPRLSEENIRQLLPKTNMQIFTKPIQLGAIAAATDVCITHGGAGTFLQFLLRGVPQMILPNHIEQLMTCKRIEALGVGVGGQFKGNDQVALEAINSFLSDPTYKKQAEEWAKDHQGHDSQQKITEIAVQILEKMAIKSK